MTSASELFSNLRTRASRSPGADPSAIHPFPSYRYPDLIRPGRSARPCSRHREAAAAAAGRSHPRLPQPGHRASQLTEHDAVINGSESSAHSESSTIGTTNGLDRPRLSTRDRLPHAVLQAQARVRERLRAISLVGVRPERINIGHSVSDSRHVYTTTESEQMPSLLAAGSNKKRPPGLSKEAFCRLPLEVFQAAEEDDDDDVGAAKRALPECPICLEGFCKGDKLTRLCCGHRFHPACMEPWARSCGDCPYCRRSILSQA